MIKSTGLVQVEELSSSLQKALKVDGLPKAEALHLADRLKDMSLSVRELCHRCNLTILNEVLPNSDIRPILRAAVVVQLCQNSTAPLKTIEQFREESSILRVLELPYAPLDMGEITAMFESSSQSNPWGQLFSLAVEKGGINSTIRNLLLTHYMNEALFAGTKLEMRMAIAQYTWQQVADQTQSFPHPDLPHGHKDRKLLKVVGTLVNSDVPTNCLTFTDYGQGEGYARNGITPTGEGLSRFVGDILPGRQPVELNVASVVSILNVVARSQEINGETETIRAINLHRKTVGQYYETLSTAYGSAMPKYLTEVESLSERQIQDVLQLAKSLELATKGYIRTFQDQIFVPPGCVFTPLSVFQGGNLVRIESEQPSTRTVTAARQAADMLGLKIDQASNTSANKGETPVSEAVTLETHGIAVVLARSASFEKTSQALLDSGLPGPCRISLGGNEHHPTQTLGEIKAFMDHYGCSTYGLDELREKTSFTPPIITFISKVDQKRADKALIRFIAAHLPHWKIKVIVPTEADVPKFSTPPRMNYEVTVCTGRSELTKTELTKLLEGTTFIYASNAEATAAVNEKGSGDGKRPSFFHLTGDILTGLNAHLLHPLPASQELDSTAFNHSNSLIPAQMANKVFVIASLIALMVGSERERRASERAMRSSLGY
jgi:ornithine carbamoyltransferase